MRELVEKVLEEDIRPALQAHNGDVALVDVSDDGVVSVSFKGACVGCPMSRMTFTQGVERILKERIPEIKEVLPVDPEPEEE